MIEPEACPSLGDAAVSHFIAVCINAEVRSARSVCRPGTNEVSWPTASARRDHEWRDHDWRDHDWSPDGCQSHHASGLPCVPTFIPTTRRG